MVHTPPRFPGPACLALLAPLLLGACATNGKTYPSLAIRDAERIEGTMDAPPGESVLPPPAPLGGDAINRIAELEQTAKSAHAAFQRATPSARNAANNARGASVASDAWANAQVALSDLDSIRSRTAVALADLDLIFVDTTLAYQQRAEVDSARARVLELVREQDRTLAQLRGLVR